MNKNIQPEGVLSDLVNEVRKKYGIDVKIQIIDAEDNIVMKACDKNIVLINKKYLNTMRDPDILKALFYHELGHLFNNSKELSCILYTGIAMISTGLFIIGQSNVSWLGMKIPAFIIGFLLIMEGFIVIRSSIRINEYIVDFFAAKELELRYYIEQLKKL